MNDEEPSFDELYHDGVLGNVLQLLTLPDGSVKALIEGIARVTATKCYNKKGFLSAEYKFFPESNTNSVEVEAYYRMLQDHFDHYAKLNKKISNDVVSALKSVEDPNDLINVVAAHLTLKIEDKQALLSERDTMIGIFENVVIGVNDEYNR